MDETFLRNVSRLGNKFRGTELGGAHTGLAGEDEEEEVISAWDLFFVVFSSLFLSSSGGEGIFPANSDD